MSEAVKSELMKPEEVETTVINRPEIDEVLETMREGCGENARALMNYIFETEKLRLQAQTNVVDMMRDSINEMGREAKLTRYCQTLSRYEAKKRELMSKRPKMSETAKRATDIQVNALSRMEAGVIKQIEGIANDNL